MNFNITTGQNIISIRTGGNFADCLYIRKPKVALWHEISGTVAKHFCLLPGKEEYKDKINASLTTDYTGMEAELLDILRPLLDIFQNGEYQLEFYAEKTPDFFRYSKIHRGKPYWDFEFTEITYKADENKKKEEFGQNDIMFATTAWFYEGGDAPILVATQPKSEISAERIEYFEEKIINGEKPFAIIFNCRTDNYQSNDFVIDGHHKLLAYKNLGIFPSLAVITHLPKKEDEIRLNLDDLNDVLYTWQMEYITKHWEGE